MYIKLKNGNVERYPYSINNLKQDNPQVSFPTDISNDILSMFEVYPVIQSIAPNVDKLTQKVVEETPNLVEGNWYQRWSVIDLSDEDVALNKQIANEMAEIERSNAYKNESDPLFFKWQRGEALEQEWLDKVAEIKQRYPTIE